MLSDQLVLQQLLILARLTGWMSFLTIVLWFSVRGGLKLSPAWQSRLCWVILLSGWSYFPGQWIISPPAILISRPDTAEEISSSALVGTEPVLPQSTEITSAPAPQATMSSGTAPALFEEEFFEDVGISGPIVSEQAPVISSSTPPLPSNSDLKNVLKARSWFSILSRWLGDHWQHVLWVTWASGILFLFLRGFFRWQRFWKELPVEVAVPEAWNEEIARWLPAGKTTPRIHWTHQMGPLLCWHPRGTCLVLPSQFWERISLAQRQAIIRHEAAHWRRGDAWWQLWAALLALPHWFNPCAWWLQRRIEDCAEWCCDEQAASKPEERTSYAQALLRVVEYTQPRLAVGSGVAGGALAERIRRIVNPVPVKESFMRKVILFSLVVLITFAAGVRFAYLQANLTQPLPQESEAGVAKVVSSPRDSELSEVPVTENIAVTDPMTVATSEKNDSPRPDDREHPQSEPNAGREDTYDRVGPSPLPVPATPSTLDKALERAQLAYTAAFQELRQGTGSVESVYTWSRRWALVMQDRNPSLAASDHLKRMEELLTLVNHVPTLRPQLPAVEYFVVEAQFQAEKVSTASRKRNRGNDPNELFTSHPPIPSKGGPPVESMVPDNPEQDFSDPRPAARPSPMGNVAAPAKDPVIREKLIRKFYPWEPVLDGLQSPYRDRLSESLASILNSMSPHAFFNFLLIKGEHNLWVTTSAADQKRIEKTLQLIQLVKSKANATDPTQGAEVELETREYQLPISHDQLDKFLRSFPALLYRVQQWDTAGDFPLSAAYSYYPTPVDGSPQNLILKVSSIPEVHQLLDVMFNPQADLDKPVEGIVTPPVTKPLNADPLATPSDLDPNSPPLDDNVSPDPMPTFKPRN